MNQKFAKSFSIGLLVLALCAPVIIAAQAVAWARTKVGDSPLSLEIPGKLVEAKRDDKTTESDWVAASQDYTFDSDDYFVQVTVFEAKPGTEINQAFLKQVAMDMGKGMQDDKNSPALTEAKPVNSAETAKLLTTYEVKTGDDKYVVKGVLIGTKDRVYSVSAAGFPAIKGSVESALKIRDSVKFGK